MRLLAAASQVTDGRDPQAERRCFRPIYVESLRAEKEPR